MHGVELVPSIMVMDNCVLGLSKMLTDRLWCIEQFCQLRQMRLLNCSGFLYGYYQMGHNLILINGNG
jgi:hypothetical protein